MAYFALLRKARTIENYKRNYEKEKHNAIELADIEVPSKTNYERLKHCTSEYKRKIVRSLKRTFIEKTKISDCILYIKTDQTFANFILKSILGFVGGIILTYFCFLFFVFQLSISLTHATIMSSIIGVLLTLGLAFSYRIRCLVFLLIPQFFSRIGRYTLTCYALVLILTGPATNTLKNSEVLSESMACGQEQIKTIVRQINESFDKPLNSMRESIKIMLDSIKIIAAKLNKILTKLKRLILSTVSVLEDSISWLNSIVVDCNKKMGSPYERCLHAFEASEQDCKANFGPKNAWVCNLNHVKTICWSLKYVEDFCVTVDFVLGGITAIVRKRLQSFSSHVKSMLFVKVHVHHSYSFSTNGSRSASQVAAGIVTEIRNMADPLMTWLSWSSYVTSFSLLLIISRAKYYQNMYETRSSYDNRYITKELMDLDFKRMKQGRDTVLPLNRRERAKYTTTSSFRLVAPERLYLSRSLVFMTITTFKLMIHMVADYSLYWILMTIRHHGRFETPLDVKLFDDSPTISGNGFVANFIRALISSLKITVFTPASSPTTCLPNPHEPDFRRYTQIGILIILLWLSSLFEPYGLRLRHMVMSLYRPERAEARAVWLFNHILKNRARFLKYARRKLHRQYKYSAEEKFTFKHWMREHIPCKWLLYLLGCAPPKPICLLCGIVEHLGDSKTILIRCETPDCPGAYCASCFYEMGEICTICMSPADYGDMSDASLEKGSSEDSSDNDDDDDDNHDTHYREPKILLQNFEYKNNPEKTKRTYYSSSEMASGSSHYQRYKIRKKGTNDDCELLNDLITAIESTSIKEAVKEFHNINQSQIDKLKNLVDDFKNNNIDIKDLNEVLSRCLSRCLIENKLIINAIECMTTPRKRPSKTNLFEKAKINRKINSCSTIFSDVLLTKAKIFSELTSKAIKRSKSYEISISSSSIRIQTHNKRMHRKHVRKKSRNNICTSNKSDTSITKNDIKLTDFQNRILNYGNAATVAARIKLDNKKKQQKEDRERKNTTNNQKSKYKPGLKTDKHSKEQGDNKTIPEIGTSLKPKSSVHRLSTFFGYKKVFNKNEPNYKKRKRKKIDKLHPNAVKKIEIKNDREYRLATYFLETNWGKANRKFPEEAKLGTDLRPSPSRTGALFRNTDEATKKRFCDDKDKAECSAKITYKQTKILIANREAKEKKLAAKEKLNKGKETRKELKSAIKRTTTKKNTRAEKKSILLHTATAATSISDNTHDVTKGPEYYLQKFLTYFRSVSHVGSGKKANENKKKLDEPINIDDMKDYAKQNGSNSKSITYVNRVIVIDGIKAFTKKLVSRREYTPKTDDISTKPLSKNNKKQKAPYKTDVGTIHDNAFKEFTESCVQCDEQRHTKNKAKVSPRFYGDCTTVNNFIALCGDKRLDGHAPKSKVDNHNNNNDVQNKLDMLREERSAFQSGDFCSKKDKRALTPRPKKHSMFEGSKKKEFITTYNTKESTFNKVLDSRYVITNNHKKIKKAFDTHSIKSNDSNTDQTICSYVAIQHPRRTKQAYAMPRIKTKANRSTLTEHATLCDAGTLTDDWWTPILERKKDITDLLNANIRNTRIAHNRPIITIDCGEPRLKRKENKNVLTKGKLISFQSQAQIIPGNDFLTPSRYLLESQKYYNELYNPQNFNHLPSDTYSSASDSERTTLPSLCHRTHDVLSAESNISIQQPTKLRYRAEKTEVKELELTSQGPVKLRGYTAKTGSEISLQGSQNSAKSRLSEKRHVQFSPNRNDEVEPKPTRVTPTSKKTCPVRREYEIHINVSKGADANVTTSFRRRGIIQKPVIYQRSHGQQTSFDRLNARTKVIAKPLRYKRDQRLT